MDDSNAVEQESAEPAMDDGSKIIFTRPSISEGSFESGYWRAHNDREWTPKVDNTNDDKTEDDVSGVSLAENVRMILPPCSKNSRSRRSRNNRNNHSANAFSDPATAATRFHKDLKTDDLDGMVVMFDAKAEQSISVVLSPWPGINATSSSDEIKTDDSASAVETDAEKAPPSAVSACLYEVVLGAGNNTTTKIRKVLRGTINSKKSKKRSFVSIPSRVCRGFGDESDDAMVDDDDKNDDNCWTSYWVCLSGSRLYVGMGKVPGKECFGVLDEEKEEEDEQQAQDEAPKESKEDDPAEAKTSTDGGQEEGKSIEDPPIRYVGIGNDAVFQKNRELKVALKNLVVTNVPPCLDSLLKTIPSQDDLPIVCLAPAVKSSSGMDVDEDAETLELKKYMEDYKAECLVRKKRAKKYGTNYREQPMKDFLPWTMAKRLQRKNNLDSMAATKQSHSNGGFVAGDIDFLDPKEISKREARLSRFAAKPNSDGETKPQTDPTDETVVDTTPLGKRDGLSIEQAWDKENMLRPIRRDPPAYLWKESPSNADTMNTAKAPDPFSMYDKTTKAATWIPDKLHVSSIDWAAFKQIRNDDLIHHLEAYGPIKYIEWLGDVSCNICFANKASASRALVCLSNELPSPPPLPKMTAAEAMTTEAATETETATLEAKVEKPQTEGNNAINPNPMIDLGCMTWRFGKRPIRKISNDRHGRKGTTARYLLRAATTEDVLIERPNSWPEPPGGFSSDRVLGPKSDFASSKNKAKTKQRNQQQQQQQQNRRGSNSKRKRGRGESSSNKNGEKERTKKNGNKNNNKKQSSNPVDLLNRGLSSSRGGFSVEEMEKERQAKKRQKTN